MTKFAYFLGSEQWQPEELIDHADRLSLSKLLREAPDED